MNGLHIMNALNIIQIVELKWLNGKFYVKYIHHNTINFFKVLKEDILCASILI
jgi:hypothetical protein